MKYTYTNPPDYPLRVIILISIATLHVLCGSGCKDHKDTAHQNQNTLHQTRAHSDTHPVVKQARQLMGTIVSIQAAGQSQTAAQQAVEQAFAELHRLEDLAHPGREHSAVWQINEAAGRHPVRVPNEIYEILKTALEVSEKSDGAFDITFAGAGKLWDFQHPDRPLPTREQLAQAIKFVDFRNLILDETMHTAFLTKAQMEIGLGAIAKGFAADSAMLRLKQIRIADAIVDVGGDMLLAGSKHGEPWTVGIQHPRKPHGELYGRMDIMQDLAVVTSGDYERGFVRDGIRYHHILNPKTGEPARLCQSVTVVGPSCALADALATAVFVMGPYQGLKLLREQYPQYDAFILDAEGLEHASPGFEVRTAFRRIGKQVLRER